MVFGTPWDFRFPRNCKGTMHQFLDCRVVQANVLQEVQNSVFFISEDFREEK